MFFLMAIVFAIEGFAATGSPHVFRNSDNGGTISVQNETDSVPFVINSLPYSQDFDSYGTGSSAYPTEWTKLNTYTQFNVPYIISTPTHSGSGSLYFNTAQNTYNIAVLPRIDTSIAVNTINLEFEYYRSAASSVLTVGVMTDPTDASTFTPVATVINTSNYNWQHQAIPFLSYTGTGKYIAFKFEANYYSGYIDDVVLTEIPLCAPAYNLNARIASSSVVELDWLNNSRVSDWQIACGALNVFDTTDASSYSTVTVANNPAFPYVFTGLVAGNSYSFAVRQSCGGAWSNIINVTMPMEAASLPYTNNFADAEENSYWILSNSDATNVQSNKWFIGQGRDVLSNGYATPADSNDNYSLYISSNANGDSNIYLPTSTKTYAYRDFAIPDNTSELKLSLDWRAKGASASNDFLRLYWMPIDVPVTDGQTIPSAYSTSAQIGNYTGGSGTLTLNNDTTWNTLEIPVSSAQFPNLANRTWRLYFYWQNSTAASAVQPPAAIDNLSLKVISCKRPTNIEVVSMETTSSTLNWTDSSSVARWDIQYMPSSFTNWANATQVTANSKPYTLQYLQPNTSYKLRIKAINDSYEESNWSNTLTFTTNCEAIDLSTEWTESFEGINTNNVLPSCWKATNLGSRIYTYTSSQSRNRIPHSGTKYVYFRYGCQDTLTTPSFNLEQNIAYRFSFYYITDSTEAWQNLKVNVYDASDNSFVNTIGAPVSGFTTNQYNRYECLFTPSQDGTYLFEIVGQSTSSSWYLTLDDFKLEIAPLCPEVNSFAASVGANSSINVSWDTIGGVASTWTIAYAQTDSSSFDPQTTNSHIAVTTIDFPYNIPNLTAGATYSIAMKNNCGEIWTSPAQITLPLVKTLPYSQDFEDTTNVAEWNIVSSNSTSWFIGHTTESGNSLYISNNGGNNNTYGSNAALSFAYAAIDFGSSNFYRLSFDWKAQGDISGQADRMQVYLVPDGFAFPTTIGTATGAWLQGNDVHKLGNDLFGQGSAWMNAEYILTNADYADTKQYLVFAWYNNSDANVSNPAAAVDNISLIGSNCGFVSNVHTTSVGADYAVITFNCSNDSVSAFEYAFGPAESTDSPDVGNVESVQNTTFTISNLNSGTLYNVWVRPICSEESQWSHLASFSTIAVCTPPANLSLNAVGTTSATISWTPSPAANNYNVVCGEHGFSLENGEQIIDDVTSDSIYILSGLISGTSYDVYVKSDCDGDQSSLWEMITLTTPVATQTLPYNQNFEDLTNINEWEYYSNGQNAWVIGSATGNEGNSLYISNNSTDNAYTTTATSSSYACVYVHFDTASQYFISFDWKSKGEQSYDKMRVYAADSNVALPTSWSNWFSNWVADGITLLSPDYQEQNTWQHASLLLDSASYAGKTKKIIFAWTNDFTGGVNPPAAIDNLSIQGLNCRTPNNITASEITPFTARLSWSGASIGTYNVKYGYVGTADSTLQTAIVSNDTTIVLTGLTSESNYVFYVKTDCGDGTSSLWASAQFTTAISCPKPTSLLISDLSQTSAKLSWTGNGIATEYIVEYGSSDNTMTQISVQDTFVVLTNLTAATDYSIKLRANCGGGDTSSFATTTFTTPCNVFSSYPWHETFEDNSSSFSCWTIASSGYRHWELTTTGSNPTCSPKGGQSMIKFQSYSVSSNSWTTAVTPPLALDSSLIVSFWMYRDGSSPVNDRVVVMFNNTPDTIGATILGEVGRYSNSIADWDSIHYTIQAQNGGTGYVILKAIAGGVGRNIFVDDFRISYLNPPAPEPCLPVSNLALSDTTQTTATITWASSTTASGYEVKLGDNAAVIESNTTHTFDSLAAGTTYTAFVRSICNEDTYSDWDSIQFTTATPVIIPCDAPTALIASQITDTSAVLTWTSSASAWQITTDTTANPLITDEVAATTYSISGLTPSTSYTYYVRANCGETLSAFVGVQFTTADAEPDIIDPVIMMDTAVTIICSNDSLAGAILRGSLVNMGSPATTETGFVYAQTPNVNYENGTIIVLPLTEIGNFECHVGGLKQDTTYYVNAFARKADGSYAYGTEIHFTYACNSLNDILSSRIAINIYPNPANHTATLSVDGLNDDANVTITDLTGKIVGKMVMKANQKTLTLNVKDYAAGIYYIRILNNDINKTQKLIVNK
jgi:hypothetical protein